MAHDPVDSAYCWRPAACAPATGGGSVWLGGGGQKPTSNAVDAGEPFAQLLAELLGAADGARRDGYLQRVVVAAAASLHAAPAPFPVAEDAERAEDDQDGGDGAHVDHWMVRRWFLHGA